MTWLVCPWRDEQISGEIGGRLGRNGGDYAEDIAHKAAGGNRSALKV